MTPSPPPPGTPDDSGALDASPAPLPLRFRFERLLGEGGLGTVVQAYDTTLRVPVAIKTIRSDLGQRSPELYDALLAHFEREAVAGARVRDCPYILAVHDLITDAPGNCFLVLEYAPGGTLRDRLVGGPLPVPAALRLTADAARGLLALHEAAMVHRDIKPENLFIAADGRAMIGDLGVVQVDTETGRTRMATGSAQGHPGTPLYMAPEQAATTDLVHPEADEYSLGAVLFELTTGARYKQVYPQEREDLLGGLPAGVAAVIRRMTAERPEERYRGMGAVLAALAAIDRSETVPAPPAPLPAATRSAPADTEPPTVPAASLPAPEEARAAMVSALPPLPGEDGSDPVPVSDAARVFFAAIARVDSERAPAVWQSVREETPPPYGLQEVLASAIVVGVDVEAVVLELAGGAPPAGADHAVGGAQEGRFTEAGQVLSRALERVDAANAGAVWAWLQEQHGAAYFRPYGFEDVIEAADWVGADFEEALLDLAKGGAAVGHGVPGEGAAPTVATPVVPLLAPAAPAETPKAPRHAPPHVPPASRAAPRMETCELTCELIKPTGRLGDLRIRTAVVKLVAVRSGADGGTKVRESAPFRVPLVDAKQVDDDHHGWDWKQNDFKEAEVGQYCDVKLPIGSNLSDNKTERLWYEYEKRMEAARDAFIAQLVGDGWEPLPENERNLWLPRTFRRPMRTQ